MRRSTLQRIERQRGDIDGRVTVLEAIVPPSGGQIVFPATQNPSSDANTLDDYEEGTWTPALTFVTPGNLSITYTEQFGRYTKVGSFVVATFGIFSTAFTHTTASGAALVTGFPFATISGTTLRFMSSLTWSGITKATYTDIASALSTGGTTSCVMSASGSGVTTSAVTAADMPTGGTVILRGGIIYTASA